jgi:hypothetical protein
MGRFGQQISDPVIAGDAGTIIGHQHRVCGCKDASDGFDINGCRVSRPAVVDPQQ